MSNNKYFSKSRYPLDLTKKLPKDLGYEEGYQYGGRLKKRISNEYPALENVYGDNLENLKIERDKNFRGIEYYDKDLPSNSDAYPMHPNPGSYGIRYNPKIIRKGSNKFEAVAGDLLHGMHQDENYQKLYNDFKEAALKTHASNIDYWWNKQEDKRDGKDAFIQNEIDAKIRQLIQPHDKEHQIFMSEMSPEMTEKGNKILEYLKLNKMQHGGNILPYNTFSEYDKMYPEGGQVKPAPKPQPKPEQNPPIYTTDPNDPRLQRYRDSLNLYNAYLMQDKLMGANYEPGKPPVDFKWDVNTLLKNRKEDVDFKSEKEQFEDGYSFWGTKEDKELINYYRKLGFTDNNIMFHGSPDLVHPRIKPIGSYHDGKAWSPVYKQPEQPIIRREPIAALEKKELSSIPTNSPISNIQLKPGNPIQERPKGNFLITTQDKPLRFQRKEDYDEVLEILKAQGLTPKSKSELANGQEASANFAGTFETIMKWLEGKYEGTPSYEYGGNISGYNMNKYIADLGYPNNTEFVQTNQNYWDTSSQQVLYPQSLEDFRYGQPMSQENSSTPPIGVPDFKYQQPLMNSGILGQSANNPDFKNQTSLINLGVKGQSASSKNSIKNLRGKEAAGLVPEGTTASTISSGVNSGMNMLSTAMSAVAPPDSKFGKAMNKGNQFAQVAEPLGMLDMVVPGLGTGLVQGARLIGAIVGGVQAKNEEVDVNRMKDINKFNAKYNNQSYDKLSQGNYLAKYGITTKDDTSSLEQEIFQDFDMFLTQGQIGRQSSNIKKKANDGINVDDPNKVYSSVPLEPTDLIGKRTRVTDFVEEYKKLDPIRKEKLADKHRGILWRRGEEEIENDPVNQQYNYVAKKLLETLPKGLGQKKQLAKYDSLTPRERQIINESMYANKFKKAEAYNANRELGKIAEKPLNEQISSESYREMAELYNKNGRLPFLPSVINPSPILGLGANALAAGIEGNYGEAALNSGMIMGLGYMGGGAYNTLSPVGGIEKNIGEYLTTQTPLRNAYKYNPWAFKASEDMGYRMLGKEGFEDAIETGVLRAKPIPGGSLTEGISLARNTNRNPNTGKMQPFLDRPYFADGIVDERYAGDYMAAVNKAENNLVQIPTHKGIATPEAGSIPIENATFYKKDWLKGYKQIDVPKPLNTSNSVLSDFKKSFDNLNPLNLKSKPALNWMEQWYSHPDFLRRHDITGRYTPTSVQENILKNLKKYESKNYIDLLKDKGFKTYAQKSISTGGVSWGVPDGIYVNRTMYAPFNKKGLESVRAHELTHLIERNGMDLTPLDDAALLKPFGYSNFDEIPKSKTQSLSPGREYYLDPTEIHARMNQARFDLGLSPDDTFTAKMFDDVSKNKNWYGMGKYIKNKDEFVELMNNFWATAPLTGTALGIGLLNKQKQSPGSELEYGGEINSHELINSIFQDFDNFLMQKK